MFLKQKRSRRGHTPPGVAIYAIGDIHGRSDLLEFLIDEIAEDMAKGGARSIVVFVGDYVDRGPGSCAVIERLAAMPFPGVETRFLRGNHDDEMLAFLREPSRGPGWAVHGGAETMASYGVTPPLGVSDPAAWAEASAALGAALPRHHRAFLEGLELFVEIGGYVFVHAGLRAGRPLAQQAPSDLMTIRDSFISSRSKFDKVVVHGHTPTSEPVSDDRRIGVDTGAYATGVLTAARLEGATRRFLATPAEGPWRGQAANPTLGKPSGAP